MTWELLIAGFTIGMAGSFHCVGMCGPIALALPVQTTSRPKKLLYILLYNAGRMLSYAALGVLFGWMGVQFFIGGYQQFLSIALGVGILLFLIFSRYLSANNRYYQVYASFIRTALGKLLKSERKFYTFAGIGFLNGLLPCGLVYVAIAGAVATGTVTGSALFMAAFGLGTFPMMFLVTVLGKFISMSWRNRMKKAVPVFIATMAVLLVLRGMNLGIPYISPAMNVTETGTHSCCHKD